MILENFIGGSYPAESININTQRTMNLIPTLGGPEGKTPVMLIGAPGLDLFKTVGTSPIRGAHVIEHRLFVVHGRDVIQVLNDASSTVVGQLDTTVGSVKMEHNANSELAIVDGRFIYVYNYGTAAFAKPNPQPVGQPTSIAFIDQYLIVSMQNSFFFALSDLNDAMTWNPVQLGAAEASPDSLLAVWALHRQLYLFGELTTEIWYDAGTSPFPFQTTSGVIDWGLQAVDSVAQIADTVVWLGRHKQGSPGGRVVAATGLEAVPISTPALEARWRSYATTADAFSFSYQMDGHNFYGITFLAGGETFVYDFMTQLWHERSSYELGAWRVREVVRYINRMIATDRLTGNLYELSSDVHDENGDPIAWSRRSPHYWAERKRLVVHQLEVEFEPGVVDSDSESPVVQLRVSRDGGHTWSNWSVATLGFTGERFTRAIWRRLGQMRDIVFEIQGATNVKVAILGAGVEITGGRIMSSTAEEGS
jgi:hypothetical protein